MKIIKNTATANGGRRITVELAPGELLQSLDPSRHYRLGQPLQDDVLNGCQLAEARPVSWCVVEQCWKDER